LANGGLDANSEPERVVRSTRGRWRLATSAGDVDRRSKESLQKIKALEKWSSRYRDALSGFKWREHSSLYQRAVRGVIL
jgi:hypothetical protein